MATPARQAPGIPAPLIAFLGLAVIAGGYAIGRFANFQGPTPPKTAP